MVDTACTDRGNRNRLKIKKKGILLIKHSMCGNKNNYDYFTFINVEVLSWFYTNYPTSDRSFNYFVPLTSPIFR